MLHGMSSAAHLSVAFFWLGCGACQLQVALGELGVQVAPSCLVTLKVGQADGMHGLQASNQGLRYVPKAL